MDDDACGNEDVEVDGDAEAGERHNDGLGSVDGTDCGSLERVLDRDEPLHREGHSQPHAERAGHRPQVDLQLLERDGQVSCAGERRVG